MSVLLIGRAPQVVDQAASAVRTHGFDVVGVTEDEEAAAALRAGGVTALVIGGGVEWSSRTALTDLAESTGAAVITGRMRFWDISGYVREELVPEIRRVTAA